MTEEYTLDDYLVKSSELSIFCFTITYQPSTRAGGITGCQKTSSAIRFALLLCLFLRSFVIHAQNQPKIDSLTDRLSKVNGSEKVDIWNELAIEYLNAQRTRSGQYADSARKLSMQLGSIMALNAEAASQGDSGNTAAAISLLEQSLAQDNTVENKRRVALQLHRLGNRYYLQSDYPRAIAYYRELAGVAASLGDRQRLSSAYGNIGASYYFQGLYDEGLTHIYQGLQIAEQAGLDRHIVHYLTLISNIHQARKDYPKAFEYSKRALAKSKETGAERSAAVCYSDLGNLLIETNKPDSALFYFGQAGGYYESVGDTVAIATSWKNMARAHRKKNELTAAVSLNQKALKVFRDYHVARLQVDCLHELAELYLDQKNTTFALQTALEADTLSSENGLSGHSLESKQLLAQIYSAAGDYRRANHFLGQLLSLRDSIYASEKEQRMQELEIRYEVDQKNQEIALQESEISRQKLVRNGLVVIFILAGILTFLIFRAVRSRQKHQQQMLAHQEELDKAKSRFFANIAHEFRTPLTLILGPAEQIAEQTREPETRDRANLIERQTIQLQGLVNQILELSKLESGMVRPDLQPGDLVAMLRGQVYSFESLADQRKIKLGFSTQPDKLGMMLDRSGLEQVFNNLLSNAFKFTNSGGEVMVTLTNPEPSCVVIRFSDTGEGIPEKDLPFIFDRFYQAGDVSTHRNPGTGIGLALTRELVGLYGGSITATSRPGKGSTFEITLPVVRATGSDAPQREPVAAPDFQKRTKPESPASYENQNQSAEVVLLIEDNADVRQFVRQTLAPHYRVMEAENGLRGVELATEHVPDLIVSDVMMPEMDGFQVCSQLKQDQRTSHIPVVLLTAKSGLDSRIEGLETGADDYLAKPFHSAELLVRLRNLLLNRKRLQEKYQAHATGATGQAVLPPREDAFLKKLRLTIEAHLGEEEFSVEDLSREMSLDRTQIHRKLKALTNLSTSLFIRQIRLQKALTLVRETDLNISEIAYEVGFSTPAYFTSCFTEQFGKTPSEMRKDQ